MRSRAASCCGQGMRLLIWVFSGFLTATSASAVLISTAHVRYEDGVTRVRRVGVRPHRVAPRNAPLGDVDAQCDGVCTIVLCTCPIGEPPAVSSFTMPCVSGFRTANRCTPSFFPLPVGEKHYVSAGVQEWVMTCEPGPAKLCGGE